MRFYKLPIYLALLLSLLGTVQAQESTAEKCLEQPQSAGCQAGLPSSEYEKLLEEIEEHPQPDAEQLPTDEDEVYKFAFRQLNENGTTVYDGPNGQVIGSIPAGDAFTTTMDRAEDWIMVQPGEWVRESDTSVMRPSEFAGMLLNEDSLEHTLAWVLLPERPAPYPGAEGDRERPRLERYTPVYIYETAEVDGWNWYLVGPDAWIEQTSIGKVMPVERPEGVTGRWVSVDLYEQVLVAYEDDTPVFATLISSGKPRHDTQLGLFQTWLRMDADAMNGAMGGDGFYNLDYVPWVLYYDESYAIHASYWHDKFGYRASHGCVNLSLTDAKWLYNWTLEGGDELPYVYIFSSGDYAGE
jgi:hypothetical protein